ncbi:hypothetical protein BKA70DRAFT_1346256 [Coprinopsis sp. MPI-PUGE-AT-0042]|nr:hypothetical protein BKA70DRAFT_1346256 [Coprinopsis sp. MPI-PUGE-AT-0042]
MTLMSSSTPAPSISEEKPRSRNAKAQARHRAKRKAYIEQLEQTVTKLQAALGYSPEQLQQDNHRLQKENDDLRRALSEATGGRRTAMAPYPDPRGGCDRDYRRRKLHMDPGYSMNESHHGERPPPLTIPNYGSSAVSSNSNSNSLFNIHGSTFQMPHTPSGSSATSSPPFSPIQMQAHPLDQRPLTGSMPHYSQNGHYSSSVKVEDEPSYQASHGSHHQSSMPYSSYSSQSTHNGGGMEWQGYSSERAQLHR